MPKATTAALLALLAAAALAVETVTQPATEPATQPTAAQVAVEEVRSKILAAGFQPMIEETAHGRIDWTRGAVFASGEGKAAGQASNSQAMALRAAQLVAARNALLLLGGLRVDPQGRLVDIQEGRLTVDGVLKDFTETSSTYDPQTRTARVTLSAPLYGASGVIALTGLSIPVESTKPMMWDGASLLIQNGPVDVVVIDARQTGFTPTLAPRIVTEDGQRVFEAADVPREELSCRPLAVCVYMKSTGVRRDAGSTLLAPLARAKTVAAEAGDIDAKLRRSVEDAFRNPVILVASGTAKDALGTIVLTKAAEQTLAIGGDPQAAMHHGRLVIVTDYEKGK